VDTKPGHQMLLEMSFQGHFFRLVLWFKVINFQLSSFQTQ